MSNPKWSTEIDIRFVSSNPIVKLLVIIASIFEFFMGIRRKGLFEDYGDRIEITKSNFLIWIWKVSETTITVQKINVTGYSVGFTKSWIYWNCIVGQLYAPGCPDDAMVFNKTSYPELKIKFEDVFAKE